MIDLTGMAATLAAFFIVAVSPGPATLALSTYSAAAGRRSGMLFGCGLGVGLAFWGVVAATGLGALLQSTTYLLTAIKIAGGFYLLWLAYGSACSALRGQERSAVLHGQEGPIEEERWFLRGLILNLSNPKAVIAWMTALSVGLGADSGWVALGVATGACIAIGFAIYAAYAAAFSLSLVRQGYAGVRRQVDGVIAVLFGLAGLGLLRSALSRV